MDYQLNGATRLIYIVGSPIAQVKSPHGVSAALQQAGHNAACVPAHVAPQHLHDWLHGVSFAQNTDGLIVTIPHKMASYGLCATASKRAHFLQAVNTLRRNADGTWHGDMFDGEGYVQALRNNACLLQGDRVLLVGAGGAGSAIAYALLCAGVAHLAVHDSDVPRRDSLIAKLRSANLGEVSVGNTDPSGFDGVLNATPIGMKADDPHPIDSSQLQASQWVGCVITQPVVPPLIEVARALGCRTTTGADMFAQVRDLMLAFLLEPTKQH